MNAVTARRYRPLELLEESLQILRSGGAPILLLHWTGVLPFAISLLWLLHDTNFSWGGAYILRDSLACAVAFVWMAYWKSVASKNTLLLLASDSEVGAGWANRIAVQAIFQTLKLFVMPLAIASVLGWPAASVFFRTLAMEPVSEVRPIRSGLKRAFAAASGSYAENAVAFLTVSAFAVVTFLNVLITIALLPSLWRMLTGYETDWSRLENPGAVFGLFSVAVIATWILIDPWIQTYSVLRVFYENSRSDGRDLLRDLSRIAALVFVCMMFLPAYGRADQTQSPAPDRQQALNHGIDDVSKGEDYGWLRPQESTAPKGFLGDLAKRVSDLFVSARDTVKSWYRSLTHWLRDVFGQKQTGEEDSAKGKPHSEELRWTLGILAVAICGAIVALFLRSGRSRPAQSGSTGAALPSADVFNEELLPSDVKQEEWLRLALEYLGQGETRLAARAFYLSNLSYLGTHNLLSLALWKTNRIYERELARKPKSGELSPAFAACNRLYERAWFGMRELGAEQTEVLRGAVEQLQQHA